MHQWYPRANGIVAVSSGVAEQFYQALSYPEDRITTIHNPVILLVSVSLLQRWSTSRGWRTSAYPCLLAVGRLNEQKDYPTPLRAFARARARRTLRLLVLGEGPERSSLEALCRTLKISDVVRLPGAIANPYAYMSRARLFVLSSAWEGFPNVLTEALGRAARSSAPTARPGPFELLQGGAFGRMVKVGDVNWLAEAMLRTLDEPADRARSLGRAQDFAVGAVADRYLSVLLGSSRDPVSGQKHLPLLRSRRPSPASAGQSVAGPPL